MRHVEPHGIAVPRVHEVDGPDIVMDRIGGPGAGHAARQGVLHLGAWDAPMDVKGWLWG